MRFYNFTTNGQAESRSRMMGSKERIKNFINYTRVYSRTIIHYSYFNLFIFRMIVNTDSDFRDVRTGFHRVFKQIDKDLSQRFPVCKNGREIFCSFYVKMKLPVRKSFSAPFGLFFNYLKKVGRLLILCRGFRKNKQPLNESGNTVYFVMYHMQGFL